MITKAKVLQFQKKRYLLKYLTILLYFQKTGTEIAEENFIHFKIYQFFQNQHERHSLNVPPQIVINRSQNLNDVFREEKNSFVC